MFVAMRRASSRVSSLAVLLPIAMLTYRATRGVECSTLIGLRTPARKNISKHKDLRIVGRAASGDVAGASLLGWAMRLRDTDKRTGGHR